MNGAHNRTQTLSPDRPGDEQVAVLPAGSPEQSATPDSWLGRGWAVTRSVIGGLLGLLPHILHHVGFLAGAALLTGAVGNGILYVVGLLFSIPMLRRLKGRFGTWIAPTIGILVFTALFALSAFVIGPAINGSQPSPPPAPSAPSMPASEHAQHH